MTRTLKINNLIIGEGIPKIIVPIVEVTLGEILHKAQELREEGVDIVEWRVDFFEHHSDESQVIECLEKLKDILVEIPILYTFRTKGEGGEVAVDFEDYTQQNIAVAKSGYAELIDVEIFTGEHIAKKNIEGIQSYGKVIVGSNHDFHQTPPEEEIISRLRHMQDLGVDIAKIAVMPQSPRDVLTLLSATLTMKEDYATVPLITMSMSEVGAVSRLSGQVFGSSCTFGAVGKGSAPGQVALSYLKRNLNGLKC